MKIFITVFYEESLSSFKANGTFTFAHPLKIKVFLFDSALIYSIPMNI